MNAKEVQEVFKLGKAAGDEGLEAEVTGAYCGDLLSDVMANAAKGELWLTIQSHQNIVAVAVLKELAGIILVNGRNPDEETKEKANAEGVPILVSALSAFELSGRLYEKGIGKVA